MNENDTIGDFICVSTITSDCPPLQPGESSSLPNAGSPLAGPDERAGVERGDPWEGGDESENERQANADWAVDKQGRPQRTHSRQPLPRQRGEKRKKARLNRLCS